MLQEMFKLSKCLASQYGQVVACLPLEKPVVGSSPNRANRYQKSFGPRLITSVCTTTLCMQIKEPSCMEQSCT